MTYRGDGEPEYIDDDEYFDPDDVAGRRGSNVLGSSGSREPSDAINESPAMPPAGDERKQRGRARNSAQAQQAGASKSRINQITQSGAGGRQQRRETGAACRETQICR